MTYAANQKILASDFDTLVSNGSNVGDHWATGNGRHGLGQSTSAYAGPAVGVKVLATQWTGLIQTINRCLTHGGQPTITPAFVTAGTRITAYAAIASGSALAYNTAGTTGLPTTTSTPFAATYTGSWGAAGVQQLVLTHTVTFTSADAARYFFNAGGTISLTYSHTPDVASVRNSSWQALAAASGTINYGYINTTKIGGSGSTVNLLNGNNGGYWFTPVPQADQLHFRQISSDAYGGATYYGVNYIRLDVNRSGADSTPARNGSPIITFKSTWADEAAGEAVSGTTATNLVINYPASGTYLTNSWGTPTVTTTQTVL